MQTISPALTKRELNGLGCKVSPFTGLGLPSFNGGAKANMRRRTSPTQMMFLTKRSQPRT